MKKIVLLTLFTLFLSLNIYAQRDCAAMEHLQEQMLDDPKLEMKMERIEQATREFLKKNETQRMDGVITIPVVVHVVYNGTAENISNSQITSQIQILNEDFRRLNADADGTWAQAADSEFEFCLATVDPNGGPTNGITRTQTSQTNFAFSGNGVKFNSSGGKDAWPAADYLNVWVCDLEGGLLGYAQFPGGPANTDGVVNDYAYFGNEGTASFPFDLGRTMTHEVGHYLNLRHIWGDGGCGVDDFVADTPESDASNGGCALGHVSCGTVDMVQNYMDYSNDACMNLFTGGQKTRMRAIFDTGGFRESLLSSPACGEPADPTCDDGFQNGDETGVDCGGPDCPACPTCDDGVQNGTEEGVDCGGADCVPCPCEGTKVNVSITLDDYPEETSWSILDSDGITVASGGTYGSEPDGSTISIDVCLANGCYNFNIFDSFGDGICCAFGNGSYEVTVGGATVASGGTFNASESTAFCIGDVEPTCNDGVQNGDEEGIDCGGSDCPDCPTEPSCDDGVQNGQETGVDCGGPDCPACPVDPSCDDGIQNGDEEGVDCGGSDCQPCNIDPCTYVDVDDEDFEGGFGIWNDGGSDCRLSNSSSTANSGTRSVRLRDNSSSSVVTTDELALNGFEEVTIDFSYIARSMETGEDFFLEASVDGGATIIPLISWVASSDFDNNSREFESVVITGAFTDQTIFRFRCDASTNSDFIFLDDIVITGCTNGGNEVTREHSIATIKANKITSVKVFPNPTISTLNIEYNVDVDSQIQINVIDMAGRRLMSNIEKASKGSNVARMQVGDLNAGIYYVHINNGDRQIIQKFVVIK